MQYENIFHDGFNETKLTYMLVYFSINLIKIRKIWPTTRLNVSHFVGGGGGGLFRGLNLPKHF